MADNGAETKQVIKPRVEIDTSYPFESVKEAVSHFGGSGPWIPNQLLPPDADDHHNKDIFDVNQMEDHAAQLERVLISRERETLNVLRELEEAKKSIESLKVNLTREGSTFRSSPHMNSESYLSAPIAESAKMTILDPDPPPALILTDLDQARLNLNKTSIDLAVIRASVESLNKKMRKEKVQLERSCERKVPNSAGVFPAEENHNSSRAPLQIDYKEINESNPEIFSSISDQHSQFNYEAEQFKKMVAASRYEVMKAMSEIERTKVSIKMAEMRLNAARKIEEAAKAVEAIAFAEKNLNSDNSLINHAQAEEITLSFEEYNALSHKAKQAEEMSKTKFVDGNGVLKPKRATQYSEAAFRRLEQTTRASYKKNSLEAAFDHEGGFKREEFLEENFPGEGSNYYKTQDSGFSSMTSKFRNFHPSLGRKDSCLLDGHEPNTVEDNTVPVYRSTISIGDILSRKLILQDDFVVGKHVQAKDERQQVSLSQMLREQSGLIFRHTKSMKDGSKDKHYFAQKKKFGFIHVVLPKHSKKKTQVVNMR